MVSTIFFSWQADRPPAECRNFIERALQRAINEVTVELNIDQPERGVLALDKDTAGVAGSPPISDTIFQKIDSASVFVPDLTFVGKRADGRPAPNPNVLIEYGWAQKSLTHKRTVAVMNTYYGAPKADNMPFNIRHMRNPITYNLAPNADEETKKSERKMLVQKLKQAIQMVLESAGVLNAEQQAASPSMFVPREPAHGQSRFVGLNESVGIDEGRFGIGQKEIFLTADSAIWLRVFPKFEQNQTWKFRELRDADEAISSLFPLNFGAREYSRFRGGDGMGWYDANIDENKTTAASCVFRTGETWTVETYLISAQGDNFFYIERELLWAFQRRVKYLQTLGVNLPFRWMAGIENMKGKRLCDIPHQPNHISMSGGAGLCAGDVIACEGSYESGMTALESIRPFFEEIFDSFGLERGEHLDELLLKSLPNEEN